MRYNVEDRVKIVSCPNPEHIGKVGKVTVSRVNGMINVRPDGMSLDRTVLLYDTEVRPA